MNNLACQRQAQSLTSYKQLKFYLSSLCPNRSVVSKVVSLASLSKATGLELPVNQIISVNVSLKAKRSSKQTIKLRSLNRVSYKGSTSALYAKLKLMKMTETLRSMQNSATFAFRTKK